MILGNGNISHRGETETPAVDLLICDRGEEPDPTSTLHSNDDACLKPPGRQVFEDIKWKTRGIMMKKSVNVSLIGFWPISHSVMMAKIKGQPFDINIIQAKCADKRS